MFFSDPDFAAETIQTGFSVAFVGIGSGALIGFIGCCLSMLFKIVDKLLK